MLEAMCGAHQKAVTGYMQMGDPSPELEWVMPPSVFCDLFNLAKNTATPLGEFLQMRVDGSWEFIHCSIRQDVRQAGWVLRPVTQTEGLSDG